MPVRRNKCLTIERITLGAILADYMASVARDPVKKFVAFTKIVINGS
jgi:hypothetical protein